MHKAWLQSGTKGALRKAYQQARQALSEKERKLSSLAICEQVLHSILKEPTIQRVHLFLPLKRAQEVDLTPLIPKLWAKGNRVILPRVEGREMRHADYREGMPLERNRWGILEPTDQAEFLDSKAIAEIDLILTPLFISDSAGHRVGFGGGYYDRFFKEASHAKRVGVNFFPPISGEIFDLHTGDLPLDLLVTPHKVYPSIFKREKK